MRQKTQSSTRLMLFLATFIFAMSIPSFAYSYTAQTNFKTSGKIIRLQQDDFQTVFQQALADAESSAVRDGSGKVIQVELKPFTGNKRVFGLEYEGNLISTVIDGTIRIGVLRNSEGKVNGFSFPDGGKVIYKSSGSNPLIFDEIEFVSPNGQTQTVSIVSNNLQDACRRAINTAGAAATAAAIACAEGSPTCAGAVVVAAVAAYNAYETCREG